MKKILLLITACIVTSILSAQYIYKIKADSVLITNDSCTAELNLENSTKNVKGFLYNKGNGRTEFRRGAIKINDSTYLIGSDTISVGSSIGKLIIQNGLTKSGDTVRLGGDLTASTKINLQDKRITFYLSDASYTPASNSGITISGARTAYNGNDMLYIQAFNRPASTFSGAAVFAETFWQPTGTVSSGSFTNYVSSQKASNANIDMSGLTLYDFKTIFFTNTNQTIGNRYHYYAAGSSGADPIMTNHIGFYAAALKRPTIANAYAFYSAGVDDTVFNAGPIRWTKYKNNATEDSILTTDVDGKLKLKFSGGNGNYIQNQTSIDQSASFRISGSGLIRGGLSSPAGDGNERFGYGALASFSSSGQANTALGYNALNAFNSANWGNTAIGYGALSTNVSGSGQTAVGSGALANHNSGSGTNTAIGYNAMSGSSGASGYSNVAVGYQSLTNISSGFQNIAIGNSASSAVTSGQQNINIGGGGLSSAASYNVGVGSLVLGGTSGSFNVALGQQTLSGLTTGSSNIGLGYGTGAAVTNGNNNVLIGHQANYLNNNSNNVVIGFQAGYNNASGSGNVFLGTYAGHYETGSNKLYIDNSTTSTPLIYGDFANDTVRVNGKFHANGPVKIDLGSDATGDIYYRNSSGQFTKLNIGTSGQVLTVSSGLPAWSAASGGGVTDGDKGDITVSGSGAAWSVDNDAITYSKMQNISVTQKVLGRNSSGSGDVEEVSLSQLLDWVGSAAQGDILYRGSSGWARLAAGTAGQVLQSNGSSANPSWVTPGSFAVVKKTSNENRSSTTTLTNDNTLTISLNASTTYHIRGKIFFSTGNATMDYKYALAYSGTTNSIMCKRVHAAAGAASGTDNEVSLAQNSIIGTTSVTATTSGIGYVEIDIIIQTNTAGTFGFQWAQDTSNGSNLTVLAGSYLEYLQF